MKFRFQLLVALVAGLAFLTIGTPAQAGCFRGLFGRHRASACSSYQYQSYQCSQTAIAAPCAPCGQAVNYAAPCAPCGQAANYAPAAPAPVYYPTQAPPIYSAPPQVGMRWDCSNGACKLIR